MVCFFFSPLRGDVADGVGLRLGVPGELPFPVAYAAMAAAERLAAEECLVRMEGGELGRTSFWPFLAEEGRLEWDPVALALVDMLSLMIVGLLCRKTSVEVMKRLVWSLVKKRILLFLNFNLDLRRRSAVYFSSSKIHVALSICLNPST